MQHHDRHQDAATSSPKLAPLQQFAQSPLKGKWKSKSTRRHIHPSRKYSSESSLPSSTEDGKNKKVIIPEGKDFKSEKVKFIFNRSNQQTEVFFNEHKDKIVRRFANGERRFSNLNPLQEETFSPLMPLRTHRDREIESPPIMVSSFLQTHVGIYFKPYKPHQKDNDFQTQFVKKCDSILKNPYNLIGIDKIKNMCSSTFKASSNLIVQPRQKMLKKRHIIYAVHVLQTIQSFHMKHSERFIQLYVIHIQSQISSLLILHNRDPHTKKLRSILQSFKDITEFHSQSNSDSPSYIYLICSPWQRNCYIGETVDFKRRIHNHIYHTSSRKKKTPLYNLLRNNGVQHFCFLSIPIPSSLRKIIEKKLILHFQPSMNVKYRTKEGEIRRSLNFCSTNLSLRFKPLISKRLIKKVSAQKPKTNLRQSYENQVDVKNPYLNLEKPKSFSTLTTYYLKDNEKRFDTLDSVLTEVVGHQDPVVIFCRHGNIPHQDTEKILSGYKADLIVGYTDQKEGFSLSLNKLLKGINTQQIHTFNLQCEEEKQVFSPY